MKTLIEKVKKEHFNYSLENGGKWADVFECKIAWKGESEYETALLQIYDGDDAFSLPNDDEFVFYPRTLDEFYSLIAKIDVEKVNELIECGNVWEKISEDELPDSDEDFIIIDVVDMYCSHDFIDDKFTSQNGVVTISRRDYYQYPDPLESADFSDEQMQTLADELGLQLQIDYGLKKEDIEDCTNEEAQQIFWRLHETIAVEMGMRYFEDM